MGRTGLPVEKFARLHLPKPCYKQKLSMIEADPVVNIFHLKWLSCMARPFKGGLVGGYVKSRYTIRRLKNCFGCLGSISSDFYFYISVSRFHNYQKEPQNKAAAQIVKLKQRKKRGTNDEKAFSKKPIEVSSKLATVFRELSLIFCNLKGIFDSFIDWCNILKAKNFDFLPT